MSDLPILLIDVDGVISLFDFSPGQGQMVMVEGVPHVLSHQAAAALRELTPLFEMVWCTGWEERAEEHLPRLLDLAGGWPHLQFDSQGPGKTTLGHWKLAAIDAYAAPDRPLAWVDDAHDAACDAWAAQRPGSTLLVRTDPAVGMTRAHADELRAWALTVRR